MKDETNSEYRGNGRISGALGKAQAYGLVGQAVALTTSALLGLEVVKNYKDSVSYIDFSKKLENSNIGMKAKVGASVVAIAITVPPLVGYIRGWMKADNAIKDHENLVNKTQNLEHQVEELTNIINEQEHDGRVSHIGLEAKPEK